LEDLPRHKVVLYRFPGSRILYVREFEQNGRMLKVRMPEQLIVDERQAAGGWRSRGWVSRS
jgi:hypothetical protein